MKTDGTLLIIVAQKDSTIEKEESRTIIQNTFVIGIGVLGLLYADIIAKAKGQDAVAFIMDKQRLEKYKDTSFLTKF